jgi:hypothetical protein
MLRELSNKGGHYSYTDRGNVGFKIAGNALASKMANKDYDDY